MAIGSTTITISTKVKNQFYAKAVIITIIHYRYQIWALEGGA